MPLYEVEKVVAVCLLEATKLVLQQLGRYRMELAERTLEAPETLGSTYGSVRRLRDYLQRSIGAYPEIVELELVDEDADIITACAARSIEVIDHELAASRLSQQDKDWLQQKQSILVEWGTEFATRALLELPGPKPSAVPSKGLNQLKARILAKLRSDVEASGSSNIVKGLYVGGSNDGAEPEAESEPAVDQSGGIQVGFGNPFVNGVRAKGTSSEPPTEAPPPIGVGYASMESDDVVIENRVLDPRAVRDPRLRPLMAMDLKAFERAVAAKDYRLAMVHLGSIVENAVLDYCLPRRSELGLQGAPETWDVRELIEKHVGVEGSAKDRSILYQLISAQYLIRPMRQITTPMVVTALTLEQTHQYVRRLLKEMGFAEGRPSAGSAAAGAAPLRPR